MEAADGVPAEGVEGAEPGVGVAGGGTEVGDFGGVFEEEVAGLLEGGDDGGVHRGTGFHGGGAGDALGNAALGQGRDDAGEAEIGDAEVVEGHPDGPVAAAILHAAEARDEDRKSGGLGAERGNQR